LRFDRFSFHYRQNPDRQILSDVSFTIPKGSRVAFVGPTGSGKSTLCDLLLGLFVPTNGQIAVDELPLDPTKLAAWRAMLGYVPQEVFLIDGTLTENIAFGVPVSQIDHDRVRHAATLAQATGFIDGQLSRQFDTVIGERGVRLSGGQRQRLGIARALYRQPQFLVLDEATSALDNTTEGELLRAIAKLPATITTITIAHRLSTVAECDCIYFLDNGRIVASGDYETLQRNCVPFRELSLAAS
jgi:ABC-type multidrug transport system fused ATPase/permease subunit